MLVIHSAPIILGLEMLGMSTELPPDLEKFAEHLNPLLDVAEQSRNPPFNNLLLLVKVLVGGSSFGGESGQFLIQLFNLTVNICGPLLRCAAGTLRGLVVAILRN